jgi:hypothetical protein
MTEELDVRYIVTRISDPIDVCDKIKNKFRIHAMKKLKKRAEIMNLNKFVCSGCGRVSTHGTPYQLHHGGISFDDLVNYICREYRITNDKADIIDFRKNPFARVLQEFRKLYSNVTPQYLCHDCYEYMNR